MQDVEDFLSSYYVSKDGEVINRKTGRKLKWSIPTNGYPRVTLHKNGARKDCSVHRLVAIVHLSNPNGYDVVNHKDGNILNPHVDNLEWCTLAWNSKHSYLFNGRVPCKGEKNGTSVLTEESVSEIKQLLQQGMKQRDIAKVFGVSQNTIYKINTGKVWGWVNCPGLEKS